MRFLITLFFLIISFNTFSQLSKIENESDKCKKYTSFCRLIINAQMFEVLKSVYGENKVQISNTDFEAFIDGNAKQDIYDNYIDNNAWFTLNKKKTIFVSAAVNLKDKIIVFSVVKLENGGVYEQELMQKPLEEYKEVPNNNSLLKAYKTEKNLFFLTVDNKLSVVQVDGYIFSFKKY